MQYESTAGGRLDDLIPKHQLIHTQPESCFSKLLPYLHMDTAWRAFFLTSHAAAHVLPVIQSLGKMTLALIPVNIFQVKF